MRKVLKNIFALTSLFFISSVALGQVGKVKKADERFDHYEYVNAIDIYEKIAEKGYVSVSTLSKLGDAYYFNGKFEQANRWYSELFAYAQQNSEKIGSEYYYRYGQTLRSMEDYEQADVYFQEFAQMEKLDQRGVLFEKNKTTYLKDITSKIQRYDIESLPINSEYSDYGSTILADQLIFTSARATQNTRSGKLHKWTNEAYTSIYSSTIQSDGTFTDPQVLELEGNATVNTASPVFTNDGTTMYFTRNNFENGRKKSNAEHSVLLKIYKATLQSDGSWGNIEELAFNSDYFNTANPALTPDNKWLYFASDREGTLGGSDLFRVEIKSDGTYGEPENLGERINTEGRETFPFISKDNQLYFSTDGRPGLGALDIFMAKINFDGSFGAVVNIGAPLNTPSDDFAFYTDDSNRKGFVSSNKPNGVGGDDIYFFKVVDCKNILTGNVYDASTNTPVAGAIVTIFDAAYNEIEKLTADQNGNYVSSALDCDQKVRLNVQAPKYHTFETAVELGKQFDEEKVVNIALDPIEEQIAQDDDLFKKLKLEPIYFDFDKSTIRPDAAVELAKVVEVMEMYPQIKLDVRSHTDSRGNDAYNMKLSQRRADSTVKWMIGQGISADRLSGKGYGESELVNKCANGVPCSRAQHQENRRSEFIILAL